MMEPFETIDIQELPLRVPSYRRKVEDFLGSNGLRLEEVDLYMAVLDADGDILAGGGLCRDIIKCIAVSEAARSLGLSVPLISRLISCASERGYANVKVFTKPENRAIFVSLGFRVLAEAPKAILMENGLGLAEYCAYLRSHQAAGVIVMNANPFTLGHRYLVEQAAGFIASSREISPRDPSGLGRNDNTSVILRGEEGTPSVILSGARRAESKNLVVIPVREDLSLFPYSERLEMIRKGSEDLADVVEGSDYQISAATFPTYFLKDLSDAAETQMRLDIDLFGRHIAPALGASVRFVGSEPADPLTARYNALMKEMLPAYGVQVVEVPRLKGSNGRFVKASRVRALLEQGRYRAAAALTPASTHPYLLAVLAERALRLELDTPLKPGLVGPDSTGAHQDMDYDLMLRSIGAIRPFFPRMALATSPEDLRQLGIDAEKAMLAATGGVNTHRGAIFALGLALFAAARTILPAGRRMEVRDNKQLMQSCLVEIAQAISSNSLKDNNFHSTPSSHGSQAVRQYGVKGAREMALEGYRDLFERWLPYYRRFKISPRDPSGLGRNDSSSALPGRNDNGSALLGRNDNGQVSCHFERSRRRSREIYTLLCIISSLDDTCIIHRAGFERAQEVKREAADILREIPGQAGNDEKVAGNDGMVAGKDDVMADLIGHLKQLCDRYAAEGVSPGGAADMLALTIFMDSIIK
jgi:citrate lyase synthetase